MERGNMSKGKCTSIIVGKDATTDGSVLLGHNEDWGTVKRALRVVPGEKYEPGDVLKLSSGQKIPQVKETYSYILPGENANGINKHQVVIADNTGSCRKELYITGKDKKGIELDEFVQLGLQRSRTAREAVEIMGKLIEKYGYQSYSGKYGDICMIADPREAWWMEIAIGGLWAAQRVPDDSAVVLANRFRIGRINLEDKKNFLACKNLIDYAIKKNWYNPTEGDFHFSQVYGTSEEIEEDYNSLREWRGNCILAGNDFSEETSPLTFRPEKKVTPQDIMRTYRDHYEGTWYDHGNKNKSPHDKPEYTICCMDTDISMIAQLRSWLPPEIGGLLWLDTGAPCSGVYMPFYLGCKDFPLPYTFESSAYDKKNAFWVFKAMHDLVDRSYGKKIELQEKEVRAIDYVSNIWKDFETREFAEQEKVEKKALELYNKDKSSVQDFLTSYSHNLALKAYEKASQMNQILKGRGIGEIGVCSR